MKLFSENSSSCKHVSLRPEPGVIEMNGGTDAKDGEEEREEETRYSSVQYVCLSYLDIYSKIS